VRDDCIPEDLERDFLGYIPELVLWRGAGFSQSDLLAETLSPFRFELSVGDGEAVLSLGAVGRRERELEGMLHERSFDSECSAGS
jgi:hypothetical protein